MDVLDLREQGVSSVQSVIEFIDRYESVHVQSPDLILVTAAQIEAISAASGMHFVLRLDRLDIADVPLAVRN